MIKSSSSPDLTGNPRVLSPPAVRPVLAKAASITESSSVSAAPALAPATISGVLSSGPEYEALRLRVLQEACQRRGLAFVSREQALKLLAQKLLAAKGAAS